MTATRTVVWRASMALMIGGVLMAAPTRADVAATGTFGIDVDVPFPFTSGTFAGSITGFDTGPFLVGGAPVDLATDIVRMSIVNGVIPAIDIPALAATFAFDAVDEAFTANALEFTGAGVAVCVNAISCSQGAGTFVGDVTSIVDPDGLLPDGYVYTFDGTLAVGDPVFDVGGVFGLNAFLPVDVPAGVAVEITSDPTTFFDSRANTLRDFLIDLTFAEVTTPGTASFLGKSAFPGALPTNIAVNPDVSILVDIVTGGGLAFEPPVDVCVHYADVDPEDGIVDGTDVAVNTLKVLHALAIGDDFQDVTTTAEGGVVCGQVGSLSPFILAVGPPPTTTTTTEITTTTTVTVTTTTTSTSTTTLPVNLSGKKLLLTDNATKTQKRKVNVLVKDGGVDLGAGPGSADDPTVAGSSLRIVGGTFDDTYALPSGNWVPLKKKKPEKGYKFKKGDPIKTILVKPGKQLKIVGKGEALGHSLGADPERVDVELRLGGRRYCMTFGGDTTFKDGKKFLAKNAPTATGCPGGGGSPSGAFLD